MKCIGPGYKDMTKKFINSLAKDEYFDEAAEECSKSVAIAGYSYLSA
jgi:hypothetical protein